MLLDVLLDGVFGDDQSPRDRLVGPPLSNQRKHLSLPLREMLKGVLARRRPAKELLDDRWVQDGPTPSDPLNARDQLGEIRYVFLEQIANTIRAV